MQLTYHRRVAVWWLQYSSAPLPWSVAASPAASLDLLMWPCGTQSMSPPVAQGSPDRASGHRHQSDGHNLEKRWFDSLNVMQSAILGVTWRIQSPLNLSMKYVYWMCEYSTFVYGILISPNSLQEYQNYYKEYKGHWSGIFINVGRRIHLDFATCEPPCKRFPHRLL
jgi:hypothetical protein